MASWQVQWRTTVPRVAVAVEAPEPSNLLPKRIGFQDVLTPYSLRLGGVGVTLTPIEARPEHLEIQDLDLTAFVEAETAVDALARAAPVVDLVMDDLRFRFQQALPLGQPDATEVGGAGRTMFSVFGATLAGRDFEAIAFPHPRLFGQSLSRKVRSGLRFYTRGLGQEAEEAFLLYWTAFEHLYAEEGVQVREPINIHGHHLVQTCPRCGRSTEQERRGSSLQAYLVSLGAAVSAASALYQTRSLVHGRGPDEGLLRQTDELRVLVGSRLAVLLGLPANTVQPLGVLSLAFEGTVVP